MNTSKSNPLTVAPRNLIEIADISLSEAPVDNDWLVNTINSYARETATELRQENTLGELIVGLDNTLRTVAQFFINIEDNFYLAGTFDLIRSSTNICKNELELIEQMRKIELMSIRSDDFIYFKAKTGFIHHEAAIFIFVQYDSLRNMTMKNDEKGCKKAQAVWLEQIELLRTKYLLEETIDKVPKNQHSMNPGLDIAGVSNVRGGLRHKI